MSWFTAVAITSSTWALLFAATTTYGSGSVYSTNNKKSRFLVNGWSLPPRQFRRDGDGLQKLAPLQLQSTSSLTHYHASPLLRYDSNRWTTINYGHSTSTTTTANRRRFRHLRTALEMRGGAEDEPEAEEAEKENDVDDDNIVMASDSGGEESADDMTNNRSGGNNDMQELREKWSDVPAVPSISQPVSDDADSMLGNNGPTLGDFDSDTTTTTPTKAIIIMDGFSPYHGQYLSHAARHVYGAAVIHVLSDFMTRYLYQVEGQTNHLSSRLPDLEKGEDVEAWTSVLPPSMEICGIYCESDSGLHDAEKLGVALGLYPRCHDGVNHARRDKFLMNQMVSEVGGLDVVQQKSCRTLEEAEIFAKELGLDEEEQEGTLVVVKPLRGVASDDVHLCSDLPSLRKAFDKILGSAVFGSSTAANHEQVLVQEFATGQEYALDIVCRDGERKVAAMWKYDKRACNGSPFVYFAAKLVSVDNEDGVESEVCNYAFSALEALGVRWGLSHVEVIASETTSPVTGKRRIRLVEVNCRQHNADFMPLTNACVGYNALDMVLAAHLGDDSGDDDDDNSSRGRGLPWDAIPAMPTTRAYGAIVHYVNHVEGTISRINYHVLEEMDSLPSVVDMHVYPQFLEVGNEIEKTVDIRSDSGWAHIMNDDEEEFRRDFERLVELQKIMFEVEEGDNN